MHTCSASAPSLSSALELFPGRNSNSKLNEVKMSSLNRDATNRQVVVDCATSLQWPCRCSCGAMGALSRTALYIMQQRATSHTGPQPRKPPPIPPTPSQLHACTHTRTHTRTHTLSHTDTHSRHRLNPHLDVDVGHLHVVIVILIAGGCNHHAACTVDSKGASYWL